MFIMLCIYLIVGIVTVLPLMGFGLAQNPSKLEDFKEFDWLMCLGFGIGGLLMIIIWPCWIGYILYNTHIDD